MSTYGYIFAVTGTHEYHLQYHSVLAFAANNYLPPVQFIAEAPSGRFPTRPMLLGMIDNLLRGDVLITTDFTTLGDTVIEILNAISSLSQRGVRLYVVNSGFRLDDNAQALVVASACSLTLQIEQELSRSIETAPVEQEPTEDDHNHPAPIRTRRSKLDGREDQIRSLMTEDISLSEIARMLDVSRPALTDFIRSREISV